MSAGRAFVDTNILVYSLDPKQAQKQKAAVLLLNNLVDEGRGLVSFQVLQEFINVMRRGREPVMSIEEVEKCVLAFVANFDVVGMSEGLLQRALLVHKTFQISWYDSLIVAAAQAGGCQILYSEDLSDGQFYGAVRVSNPFRSSEQS